MATSSRPGDAEQGSNPAVASKSEAAPEPGDAEQGSNPAVASKSEAAPEPEMVRIRISDFQTHEFISHKAGKDDDGNDISIPVIVGKEWTDVPKADVEGVMAAASLSQVSLEIERTETEEAK